MSGGTSQDSVVPISFSGTNEAATVSASGVSVPCKGNGVPATAEGGAAGAGERGQPQSHLHLDATAWAPYTGNRNLARRVVLIMTVTVKNKTKTPLVVPPSVRRLAGHKNGEDVEFRVSGGVITILPKLPTADDHTPVERHAIDRGIAQSEKEYREGKNAGPFDTAEALAASMEADIKKLRKARRKAESAR